MEESATAPEGLHAYYLNGVPEEASARYRVLNALEQLRLAGVEGSLLPQDCQPDSAFSGHGSGPSVLVIHRAQWDERLAALIEAARVRRIRVLYDIDDLVFEPIATPWMRALLRLSESDRYEYEDGVRRHLRALKACDAMLTTTRALASCAASAEGLPVFVHRNGFDQRSLEVARMEREARTPREVVTLYYGSGSGTHDVDFQACALALERLLRKHRSLHLITQGDVRLGHGLEVFGERIERWPWMPWPDYFRGLARADVNIAPLELGNPFCEVKSELKWFEAALMGIPTVASATEAFREVIRSGLNGFLAESTDEWFEILDALVGDPKRRQSVGAKAEAEVLSHYQPTEMGRQLLDLLTRIASAEDLVELARVMDERAVIAPRVATEAATKKGSSLEVGPRGAVRIGGNASLDDLALDVTCRREDGLLSELQPGKEVAQTFQCKEPNLAAIAVKTAVSGRRDACSLEMVLYEDDSLPPPERVRQSVSNTADDGWVVFHFQPVSDSADRCYRFVISSPDAKPGNACALFHASESLYRQGQLHANGRSGNGALVFQTFVKRADADDIRELIRPERASIVDDLSTALSRREAELAEKNAILIEKEKLLAEKDALITQKDVVLIQKDAALAAAEVVVAEHERTVREATKELDSIHLSKGYRLLKGYRGIVRRLFPAGSRLGAFYQMLVGPIGYVLDTASRLRRK